MIGEKTGAGGRPKSPSNADLTPSLVARLRSGDSYAGRLLDGQYRQRMLRYFSARLNSYEDVEDAVQEVFRRVLASRRVPQEFRTWIYMIARTVLADVRRRRFRKPSPEHLPSGAGVQAPSGGPVTRFMNAEQQAVIRRTLERLGDDHREPLLLHYFDELTVAQIAVILELRDSVIKSRLYEGMKKLRQIQSE